MLLQLSQFSPLCLPSTQHPPLPQATHPPLFMSTGHAYKLFGYSHFLYCTLHPHGYSVTTYLYFLIPSALHPFSPTPSPSGSHQNTLHIHDSLSVVLVCLVCFLDSIFDRYVFTAILLFILIFIFFFCKSRKHRESQTRWMQRDPLRDTP